MAQPPPDHNFYHHHNAHGQLQLPPQFRNPFDLLFDERTGAINYNYMRPYIPNQLQKPDELSDTLVMRRPRRTRTTFTSAQIAELEQHFQQARYLTSSRLAELSNKLVLGTAQVKIWFKNRRRRHKIQSDQQKDSTAFSCEGVQLSPTLPTIKTESRVGNSIGPPNIQTLTLGSSGGSTPTTLTPSPTPTTPSANMWNMVEHYGDSYNTYYYNNHHQHHQAMPSAGSQHAGHSHVNARATHYQPTTAMAAPGVAQYYPPALLQQQQQLRHQHNHNQQQQQIQPPQYYTNRSHQQYEYQQKAQTAIKKDTDYNYNSAHYYVHMPVTTATVATTTASTKTANDAMSANSDVYEPLTPKHDESTSLYNGGDRLRVSAIDAVADEMDKTNLKSLQVLLPKHAASACKIENNGGSINIMEDCNGAFSKYSKMSVDNHDANYHAYTSHRNPASTQFAYCFN